ncbi:MAG: bifunctional diaminohydroxyphosphoribosylaminopyrimidine deaminase/5-amino-6-(5-phosphoribosylamino)uracil reductase RibD [Nitrosomonadales bacterium]|nr:bifunctional diaminohydroxyphosphoribosylaminopyrimidine deaminase/5-amino-6-(5-phosphoribosylamino)uracil reductase RibD [Nitrosomonadales bacterium]
MFTARDSAWMAQALRLAELGLYGASPNPRVGCVLVRDDTLAGQGWHRRAGEAHAEVHALNEAGDAAQGATAYVTLEPCNHHGRTPPCTDALIAAGVARVVVAVQDPNPQVSGAGIAKLREAGIAVDCGLMEAAARELNIGFFSRMTRGTPWVRSKIAMSLDGRTALGNGISQWITGEAARHDVQRWRARSCAVLTGVDTVLADDARLNVREIDTPRQPLRVVLDSRLRIPLDARILYDGGTLVYAAQGDEQKIAMLQDLGATVSVMPGDDGRVDLEAVLRDLAQRGCNEVMVEAGSTLSGALLRAGQVDELLLYVAPQLLGDAARSMVRLGEMTRLEQRIELQWQDVRQIGNDLRITIKVKG